MGWRVVVVVGGLSSGMCEPVSPSEHPGSTGCNRERNRDCVHVLLQCLQQDCHMWGSKGTCSSFLGDCCSVKGGQ